MKAIIITIGDEILIGQIIDTNSQYIAKQLVSVGFDVAEILSLPDQRSSILLGVEFAMNNSDLVIVTGGLGPTKDDITKKVLADYFDTRLIMNDEALVWVEQLLEGRSVPMNEYNRSQAILPENCRILHNMKGTAAGMWFERNGKTLIALPGVPFEMAHLMEDYIVPDLKMMYPNLQFEFKIVKIYNLPESVLAEKLSEFEDKLPEGVSLAYLPSIGYVKLRLTAKGNSVRLLESVYDDLIKSLDGLNFMEGEDENIEKKLGHLLRQKGSTVAVAESCTGGYLSHLITSIPGSSDYFSGGIIAYSNDVKMNLLGVDPNDLQLYGAVSEEVVKKMADSVRVITNSNYAISISGIAGPGGGSEEKPVGTVWIGISTDSDVFAKKFVFSFTRERNIARASLKGIEMLIEVVDQ